MKTADLYIRVSADEQADKGYSQRGQEELLRRYRDINKLTVLKVIYEDHSAKRLIVLNGKSTRWTFVNIKARVILYSS